MVRGGGPRHRQGCVYHSRVWVNELCPHHLAVAEGATIVVKEEGRDAVRTVMAATGPPLSTAPLTVLVDGDTASAAEILAGESWGCRTTGRYTDELLACPLFSRRDDGARLSGRTLALVIHFIGFSHVGFLSAKVHLAAAPKFTLHNPNMRLTHTRLQQTSASLPMSHCRLYVPALHSRAFCSSG